MFSSCTNAAEVLKAHVEKLPLQDENQIIVEDRSVGTVDALYDTLSERGGPRTGVRTNSLNNGLKATSQSIKS